MPGKMHYKDYTPEDFIQDEFFQQWVYAPNDERNRYWETFLIHYPGQRAKIKEARQFLLSMDFKREVPGSLLRSMKAHINDAIDRADDIHADEAGTGRRKIRATVAKRRTGYYYRAAAVVLVLCLAGYFFLREYGAPGPVRSFSGEHLIASKGSRLNVVLPDGTAVWLNAGSSLRYARSFNRTAAREVYLEGEAFFDVAEDTTRQFVVNTSDIAIKVLGTVFNVRSYPTDRSVETTLVQGKVTIESPHEANSRPVILAPNQKAVFARDSKKIELKKKVNTEDDIAWKDGWIVFEDKPFVHIIETLERWYDVKITMDDEQSLACTFSAKFKDKTLEEVLEIFKNTESINYKIDGSHVSITGKLCEY